MCATENGEKGKWEFKFHIIEMIFMALPIIGAIVLAVSNSRDVPGMKTEIQAHEVRISVIEAHQTDIMSSLRRIEEKLK